MSNRLVTLATFPAPAMAGFIKNLLVAEGVPAFVADEVTMVMLWHLSAGIGWAKVQVAETDVSRANEILEVHRQTLADLGPLAFGITFVIFLEYSVIFGSTALFLGFGGSVVAAFCIREFVRWINRRDDPRHASRPVA